MTANTTYVIKCKKCTQTGAENSVRNIPDLRNIPEGQYRGQTGRSMHSRMLEHMRGLKSKSGTCPLYRHSQESHEDDEETPTFIMEKSRKARNNLDRLAIESEEIYNGDNDKNVKLWNSKSEYGKTKLIRWQPTLSYG